MGWSSNLKRSPKRLKYASQRLFKKGEGMVYVQLDPLGASIAAPHGRSRWKAIMEGGATPAVRQLRTSGTRGRSSRPEPEPEFAVAAGGWRSEAAWRREREGSGLGHEEWDRRFESFIKKSYEQIRLQRQETAHPDG